MIQMKIKIACFLIFEIFLCLTLQLNAQEPGPVVSNKNANYFKKNRIASISLKDPPSISKYDFDKQGRLIMLRDSAYVDPYYAVYKNTLCYYFDSLGRKCGYLNLSYDLPAQYFPDTTSFEFVRLDKHNLRSTYILFEQTRTLYDCYNDSTQSKNSILRQEGDLVILRNDTQFYYNLENGDCFLKELSIIHYATKRKKITETTFHFVMEGNDTMLSFVRVCEFNFNGWLEQDWTYASPGDYTISNAPATIPQDWRLMTHHSYTYKIAKDGEMEEMYEYDLLKNQKKTWNYVKGQNPYDDNLAKIIELVKNKSPLVTVTYY
jgi:hypothetical protein